MGLDTTAVEERETLPKQLHIGTAGWQLPAELRPAQTLDASALQRYSALFNTVEINSTHYKLHKEETFQRWAAAVPRTFRFSVKMHRSITHEQRLAHVRPAQEFLQAVSALGDRLGPVLIQLPPSLVYDAAYADFVSAIREVYDGQLALEPRHPSWAKADVQRMLKENRLALVAADPPLITDALQPGGHADMAYFRLHGSPRVYWSAYDEATLASLAARIRDLIGLKKEVWVIFDNTASGQAAVNALRLHELTGAALYEGRALICPAPTFRQTPPTMAKRTTQKTAMKKTAKKKATVAVKAVSTAAKKVSGKVAPVKKKVERAVGKTAEKLATNVKAAVKKTVDKKTAKRTSPRSKPKQSALYQGAVRVLATAITAVRDINETIAKGILGDAPDEPAPPPAKKGVKSGTRKR